MLYAIYFVNVFLCPVNHKLNLLEGKTIEDEHGDLSEVFFAIQTHWTSTHQLLANWTSTAYMEPTAFNTAECIVVVTHCTP